MLTSRYTRVTLTAVFAVLATPGTALATRAAPVDAASIAADSAVRLGVSGLGLVIAIILLLEALGVRKVALGGVIAEKISYVLLAIICLAGSALAFWARNFVEGVTLAQVQLASEILVIVAMALFAAYFYSVRSALQRYLKAMTGTELLAKESNEAEPAEVSESGTDDLG